MNRVAQIVTATGYVSAVVRPKTPLTAPDGMTFVEIEDSSPDVSGKVWNGTTFEDPAHTPVPLILSKTAFQDHAVSQLGGGLTGMGRFTAIMDATRDSASGAVRFAYARYQAAQTFEKTNTASLTAVMAADTQTGHLTTDERAAILDNWPEA